MKKHIAIMLVVFGLSIFTTSIAQAWTFYPITNYIYIADPILTPTTNPSPSFSVKSSIAGDLSYEGACGDAYDANDKVVNYINGNNKITQLKYKDLPVGTYYDCKIILSWMELNGSFFENKTESLYIPNFEVKALPPPQQKDVTPPELKIVAPVDTPTYSTKPEFTFWSSEDGNIIYSGSCSSNTSLAKTGNNLITFNSLKVGKYENCKLKVTDSAGNASSWLNIPNFEIIAIPKDPINVPSSDYCAGFSDVSKTDSACDAIAYVKSIGAMTGNPNGTFAPSENLQRDQVAKISLETFGLFNSAQNYCSGNPFPDVTTNDWSYQYICRGVSLGMITGYASGADAGFYRPARSVNRVEFLALILRNLNETMPSVNSTSYKDVPSGEWFSGFAKYSYDNSLFTGTSLYPDRFVTRREVAKAIYQLHLNGKI